MVHLCFEKITLATVWRPRWMRAREEAGRLVGKFPEVQTGGAGAWAGGGPTEAGGSRRIEKNGQDLQRAGGGKRETRAARVALRFLAWSLGRQVRWERSGVGEGPRKDLLGLRCRESNTGIQRQGFKKTKCTDAMYAVGVDELSWGDSVEKGETKSGKTWPPKKG